MTNMSEFAKRRQALMQKMNPDDIIILPAAKECLRNGDSHYPFRQNSDFYYLSGFEEPNAVLIIAPNRKEGEYILFNQVRDPVHEIWNGPRAGQEGACKTFGADQAFPIEQFENMLPDLLTGRSAIHYPLGAFPEFDELILKAVNAIRAKIRGGVRLPTAFIDTTPTIHEMRLFKSAAEIATMQKAVDITAAAHIRAMQVCKPGMYEYELEAELMYVFQREGARYCAYNSIVGAGKNSCILHYINNNQKIKDGDLVLIDAGAEYQNYAADITRTFPANGRFSDAQRVIYDLVLSAQLAAIEVIKPGASWIHMQSEILRIITAGLVDLGILKGDVEELIAKQAYMPFYMHRSGHWLGLDVHDAGRYRIDEKWRELEPGMMLTVEPGIYISADNKNVDPQWHNIGIRIEDDVLVTEKSYRVLSAQIPKTIADIEATMAK